MLPPSNASEAERKARVTPMPETPRAAVRRRKADWSHSSSALSPTSKAARRARRKELAAMANVDSFWDDLFLATFFAVICVGAVGLVWWATSSFHYRGGSIGKQQLNPKDAAVPTAHDPNQQQKQPTPPPPAATPTNIPGTTTSATTTVPPPPSSTTANNHTPPPPDSATTNPTAAAGASQPPPVRQPTPSSAAKP